MMMMMMMVFEVPAMLPASAEDHTLLPSASLEEEKLVDEAALIDQTPFPPLSCIAAFEITIDHPHTHVVKCTQLVRGERPPHSSPLLFVSMASSGFTCVCRCCSSQ